MYVFFFCGEGGGGNKKRALRQCPFIQSKFKFYVFGNVWRCDIWWISIYFGQNFKVSLPVGFGIFCTRRSTLCSWFLRPTASSALDDPLCAVYSLGLRRLLHSTTKSVQFIPYAYGVFCTRRPILCSSFIRPTASSSLDDPLCAVRSIGLWRLLHSTTHSVHFVP